MSGFNPPVWLDELSDIEFGPDYDAQPIGPPPRRLNFHGRRCALRAGVSAAALGIAAGSTK